MSIVCVMKAFADCSRLPLSTSANFRTNTLEADFHSVECSERTKFYTIGSLSRAKFYSYSKRHFLT